MASISLVSLNVERSQHLDLVLPFVAERQPDVLCVQELMEHDVPAIAEAACADTHFFEPMTRRSDDEKPGIMGVGIFSRLPVAAHAAECYVGTRGHLGNSLQSDPSTYNELVRPVLWCDVSAGGALFRIATTHFTWTPDGQPDDAQRRDIRALLSVLERLGEFVLAGDLNAPRGLPGQGGEIFNELSSRYTDNIPTSYLTSIDASLHRNGKDRPHELADKMVDGLFTTPAYSVPACELISGVSDHCAIAATVERLTLQRDA